MEARRVDGAAKMHKQPPSHDPEIFFHSFQAFFPLESPAMNVKPLLLSAIASAALIGWLAVPHQSNAQTEGDAGAADALLLEISAQQTVIAENQAKIDAKLAGVGEELRVARIYVGRAGGKAK